MSIARYIDSLSLSAPIPGVGARVSRGLQPQATARDARPAEVGEAAALPENMRAAVDTNALLSFVDGVDRQARDDVLFSVQLAVRGASGKYDRFTETRSWYQKYIEVLENLGWVAEQFAFARHDQTEGKFRMDQAALEIITAIATQNQLTVLNESIRALEKLAEDDGTLRLFDFHSSLESSGNFQIGAVQRADNGTLSVALGAFYFRAKDERRRFLFFSWGSQDVNFWTAAQKLTLNTTLYAPLRDAVIRKLTDDALDFIGGLDIA